MGNVEKGINTNKMFTCALGSKRLSASLMVRVCNTKANKSYSKNSARDRKCLPAIGDSGIPGVSLAITFSELKSGEHSLTNLFMYGNKDRTSEIKAALGTFMTHR